MNRVIKFLFGRRRSRAKAGHLALGERGERAALDYLREYEGFSIVATNFVVPLGRGLRGQKERAEIDLIAYDGDTLVFVEVKTRSDDSFAPPERAVDLRKQRRIARAARRYRQLMDVASGPYRYDVVTVVSRGARDRVELLRAYFDDSIFQRSRYFRAQER